jgi:hypothetical protein
MTVDDCINVFGEEFTRNISVGEFWRKYVPNIRYNFESDGEHGNLGARGCQYMFSSSLDSCDTSGCPLKFMPMRRLKEFLVGRGGLSESDADFMCNVIQPVGDDKRHPLRGCWDYFRQTHYGYRKYNIYSSAYPNMFFSTSCETHHEMSEIKAEMGMKTMSVNSSGKGLCAGLPLVSYPVESFSRLPVVQTYQAFEKVDEVFQKSAVFPMCAKNSQLLSSTSSGNVSKKQCVVFVKKG